MCVLVCVFLCVRAFMCLYVCLVFLCVSLLADVWCLHHITLFIFSSISVCYFVSCVLYPSVFVSCWGEGRRIIVIQPYVLYKCGWPSSHDRYLDCIVYSLGFVSLVHIYDRAKWCSGSPREYRIFLSALIQSARQI